MTEFEFGAVQASYKHFKGQKPKTQEVTGFLSSHIRKNNIDQTIITSSYRKMLVEEFSQAFPECDAEKIVDFLYPNSNTI